MKRKYPLKTCPIRYDKERPPGGNKLNIQDVSFRDGQQSLFATRGRTEDMIPVAEMMDEIGFWAMEVWGGATFDTMHRFLNEDPWQRLRTLKGYIRKTPLSMLLRGQNLVGYRNYADDVVTAFVERACVNGIDIFRTFDALNDFRNFETVLPVIKKNRKHFQGCLCFSLTEPRMGGDIYTIDYYIKKAKDLEKIGADSICIKDMAGLLAPYDAYELVKAIKAVVKLPVHLHSHYTSGMAQMTQLKAIEAGVDIIDTCMSPYAFRTSHPAIEPLVITLLGTNRDTGFDINHLAAINKILEEKILPKYKELLNEPKMSIVDINVLLHQIPGGMLSSLLTQLKEIDALDKIDEVFKELPRVRKELGQIPLVTPTSQVVGIQAVNNVLFDDENERYKRITSQVKDLCYGLYGATPAPINSSLQKKALKGYEKGEKPVTCRPAELLNPELEKAKKETEGIAADMDDVLIAALYPTSGKKFLQWKYGKEKLPEDIRPKSPEGEKSILKITEKAKTENIIGKEAKGFCEKNKSVRRFNFHLNDKQYSVKVDEISDPKESACDHQATTHVIIDTRS